MTLKETFPAPFRFSIVHHANGDVKLILPEGISIYFSSRGQTSEFTVTPSKKIHNFHNQKLVQMRFEHPRKGVVEEAYFTSKQQVRRVWHRTGKEEWWQLQASGWAQKQ